MKRDSHDEDVLTCDGCGASVYEEHIESGIAKYQGDQLLCSHCVAERGDTGGGAGDSAIADVTPIELDSEEEEEESGPVEMSSSRIHALTGASRQAMRGETKFQRDLQTEAQAATRCRTFHCRLSEGAVEFMNAQINEWVDQHDDITIKFVTSTIGQFEGKHTEPNLIMTVFY